MPARWSIDFWPICESHVFLSHCQEDRDELVTPVFERLKASRLIGWIDRHHYPMGTRSFETLREELLKCRHIVYFVTPSALKQGRGWMQAERAYAGTIQDRLHFFDREIVRLELPLLFIPRDDSTLQRSVWRSLLDKKVPISPRPFVRRWTKEHVQWAAEAIEQFVRSQERESISWAEQFRQDPRLKEAFKERHLRNRVLARTPADLGME